MRRAGIITALNASLDGDGGVILTSRRGEYASAVADAVAEALWILSGSDDPWIFDYNRALTRYTDDGRLQGAYGPRMRRWAGRVDQLDQVSRPAGP